VEIAGPPTGYFNPVLDPRYRIVPQPELNFLVFPAGYVAPVDPLAPTLMDSLHQAHGYSLLQWLAEHGIVPAPPNGSNNNDPIEAL
jgi:hypothetical protein